MNDLCKDKIFVVTGGAGFVGSALVDKLLKNGAKEVRIIDSFYYQQDYDQQAKTIAFTQDLADCTQVALNEICQNADAIFHLAAQKHNQNQDNKDYMYRTNVDGTYKLLKVAEANNIKKFIFTSSLYAYGRNNQPELVETENIDPATFYGSTKRMGELLCNSFAEANQMACAALRLFFVYGPGQLSRTGYESLMVKSINRINQGENPLVYGDGKQVLDYIYIDDVVEALILSLKNESGYQMFNVGSGSPSSVLEISEKIIDISKTDLKLQFEPEDATAGTYRVASTNKAVEVINFKAGTDLDAGLTKTYEALKN